MNLKSIFSDVPCGRKSKGDDDDDGSKLGAISQRGGLCVCVYTRAGVSDDVDTLKLPCLAAWLRCGAAECECAAGVLKIVSRGRRGCRSVGEGDISASARGRVGVSRCRD